MQDGNVGIGITSPGGNLQVASENRAFSVLDSGANNYAEAGFTLVGGDDPAFGRLSGYDIQFRTGTTRGGLATAMTIKSDGKIGVRTTAPQTGFEMLNGIISVRSSASGTNSVGTDKGIALVCADMNTTAQFTPGVLFGSTDSGFSTNNPRYNAGIFGRADQTYNDDSDTGMSIQMRFAGNNAGTGHGVTGAYGYAFGPSVIHSTVDNFSDLGLSSRRYDDVYATNGTIQTSDVRDKADVEVLGRGLEFVNALNPVSFRWSDRGGQEGTRTHWGLLAQDVAEVLGDDAAASAVWIHAPSVDEIDEDGNTVSTVDRQGLRYGELIAPLVKAVQELSAQNAELTARIEALEN